MTDALVVFCNLKIKKLAGYKSFGIVLRKETENKDVVELIDPQAEVSPGI